MEVPESALKKNGPLAKPAYSLCFQIRLTTTSSLSLSGCVRAIVREPTFTTVDQSIQTTDWPDADYTVAATERKPLAIAVEF